MVGTVLCVIGSFAPPAGARVAAGGISSISQQRAFRGDVVTIAGTFDGSGLGVFDVTLSFG